MGHHPYGANRPEQLAQADLFQGSELETESAFVAAVNRRAADRRPQHENAKPKRGHRRRKRRLVAAAAVLLAVVAIGATGLMAWPRPGGTEVPPEPVPAAPAAVQEDSAADTAAATGTDIDVEVADAPIDTATAELAGATGSLPVTGLSDTASENSAAWTATSDGLPPLPGEKPDPG